MASGLVGLPIESSDDPGMLGTSHHFGGLQNVADTKKLAYELRDNINRRSTWGSSPYSLLDEISCRP